MNICILFDDNALFFLFIFSEVIGELGRWSFLLASSNPETLVKAVSNQPWTQVQPSPTVHPGDEKEIFFKLKFTVKRTEERRNGSFDGTFSLNGCPGRSITGGDLSSPS